jgi:hypothetical protein
VYFVTRWVHTRTSDAVLLPGELPWVDRCGVTSVSMALCSLPFVLIHFRTEDLISSKWSTCASYLREFVLFFCSSISVQYGNWNLHFVLFVDGKECSLSEAFLLFSFT